MYSMTNSARFAPIVRRSESISLWIFAVTFLCIIATAKSWSTAKLFCPVPVCETNEWNRFQSLASRQAESDCTRRVTNTHVCSADPARAREKWDCCERGASRLGQKYLAIFLLGVSNSFLSQSRCSQTLLCETKEATPTLRGRVPSLMQIYKDLYMII